MTVRSAISLGVLLLLLASGVALFRQRSAGVQVKPIGPPGSTGVDAIAGGASQPTEELARPGNPRSVPAHPEPGLAQDAAGERSSLNSTPKGDQTEAFIVRVLSEDGAPVAGVSIALEDTEGSTAYASEDTGSNGQALFSKRSVVKVKSALSQDKTVLAKAGVLGSFKAALTIDAAVLEEGVLDLTVPSHGSVRVTVTDMDGAFLDATTRVSLGFVRDDEAVNTEMFSLPRESAMELALNERGQAIFPVVELGGLLELRATREGSPVPTRAIVRGPVVAGSTLDVPLIWGTDHAVLRFRVIDQVGAPLTNTKLRGRFATRFMGFWDDRADELETSSDGTLQVDLSNNWVEGNERRLDLELHSTDAKAIAANDLRATIDLSQAFAPGLNVLDDVQMVSPPTFVSGSVIDADGRPQQEAKLVLEVFENSNWNTRYDYDLTSDSDGMFEAYRQEPGERFRLSAEVEGLVGTAVEFDAGQEGLVLELLPGGMVSGQVLFGNGLESDSIRLQLRLMPGPDGSGSSEANVHSGEVESDGRFQFDGLATGSYILRVLPVRGWTELWMATGIEVLPGVDLGDPRLEPIDLRSSVFMHRVTLHVPENAQLTSGQLNSGPVGAESLDYRLWFNRSKEIEVLGEDRIDLVVSAAGFQVEHAFNVSGDVELDLRRAPQVRLRVDGAYTLPEPPFYVRPILVGVDSDSSPSYDWNSPALDTRREVVIPAQEPGLCEVRWLVQRQGDGVGIGSVSKSLGHQVNVIDSDTEQSASIVLTQQQLDEILSQLKD